MRYRALLLLGFVGALRRSDLVAIDREHLRFTGEGMTVLIPRARRDPEEGRPSAFRAGGTRSPAPCGRWRPGSAAAGSSEGGCSVASARVGHSRTGSARRGCGRSCAGGRRWPG